MLAIQLHRRRTRKAQPRSLWLPLLAALSALGCGIGLVLLL